MGSLMTPHLSPHCLRRAPGRRLHPCRVRADDVVCVEGIPGVRCAARRRADVPRKTTVRRQQDTSWTDRDGACRRTGPADLRIRVLSHPSVAPGLWPLTMEGYAAMGAWCALGFMLGELPNSFLKRQLDIAPGAASTGRGLAWQLVADRLDSGIGLLLAASLVVHVPWTTWAIVLSIGPIFHWSFSVLMFQLGIKPRPA